MKQYTFNGETYTSLPDPLKTASGEVSPMSEKLFVQLGGVVHDDGQPTPKEKFFTALDTYLEELEKQAREKYALNVTVAEFKEAAATKMSGELVAWAKGKGVPDSMIEDVRKEILTMVADASRIGLTWGDIFPKTN